MKKLFFLILAAGLILSLAACGAVVDYDTPKSEELSAAYDFYRDSQASLASGMAITPEQADEVFIVLVSCGMDGKVSNVTRKQGDDGHCTVNTVTSFTAYDVYYTDGVVDRVEKGGKELYPNPEPEPEEPDTTEPNEPETPATLEELIDAAIDKTKAEKEEVKLIDAESEENQDEKRVEIYLAGSENLTTNMTRKGMWIDANDILKALQPCENISEIVITFSLPLIDAYGNPFEDTVMVITVSKATLDKINFDRFLWEDLPDIADDYFQHRVLNEE